MSNQSSVPELQENIDYTIDSDGNFVLTRAYLLKRGRCCQSGCQNCPYDYHQKVDPNIPAELQPPWGDDEDHYDFDDINE